MLAKIREKTQGIIATLILCFVAIPFILWGIGSYFEGSSSVAVAEVNGMEISQQAYRERLEELRAADPKRADNRAMKELILDSLIDQTLLLAEAEDRGYRLSDARLAQTIRDIPYFQRDGRFEPALYESLLRRQGMRTGDFETRLRRDNVAAQVQRGLSDSAFVTEADVAAMVRLLRQERHVSYTLLQPEGFLSKVNVSAQEVEDHYKSNQDSYRTPEAVRVEHLTLTAADVAKDMQPTEEELRQAYSTEAARFVTPEKRRASHLLINLPAGAPEPAVQSAQARSADLAKQARAGGNFQALAKKHSDDKDSAVNGGDLGEIRRGTLPPELETAIFSLKPGEIAGPVRTQYGFHVVKLTSHTPEQRQSYESAKRELLEQVRKRKGEERFFELSERFRNLVYEHPEGLQTAAKQLGLTIQTGDWFTRSGGSGVASHPRVVTAAFEPDVLSQARNSDAIDVNPETIVSIHVVGHRPSTVKPLDEVRASIERTLKEQRAREQAKATADDWLTKLQQGTPLKELARQAGATLHASKALTREQTAGVDRRLAEAVFAAPRPQNSAVHGQVDLASQGTAVYALESVRDGDPATADTALKEKARRQLLQRRGADYYTSYRSGLRKSADVKINADQL